MTRTVEFFVSHAPAPQQRPRTFMSKGRVVTMSNPRGSPCTLFKLAVSTAARKAMLGKPMEGPLSLYLSFLIPRPQRLIWKQRPMPREPHCSRPDWDNYTKAVKDAMSGIVWVDDGQVWRASVVKQYAAGDEDPGVFVTVRQD